MVAESEVLATDEIITATDPIQTQLEANRSAAAELLGESQRQAALQAQLESSNQILVAQCAHLLDTGLGASRLPEVVQNRIRKSFEGRSFKAAELTGAIQEARDEVAARTRVSRSPGCPGSARPIWP